MLSVFLLYLSHLSEVTSVLVLRGKYTTSASLGPAKAQITVPTLRFLISEYRQSLKTCLISRLLLLFKRPPIVDWGCSSVDRVLV